MALRRRVGIGCLCLAAAGLAWWCAAAGPSTVYRIIVHNFSGIEDHRIFPQRALRPSPRPFLFRERPDPSVASIEVGGTPLARILEANGTVAFLVVKEDTILFERYYDGFDRATASLSFSVSKSVLSLLVGCALDDGILPSVERPVTDYVPELAAPGFRGVRLRHLLQMTSGLDYDENDLPFGIHARCYYTDRLEDEILAFGIKEAPGTRFVYRSGDAHLLSLALDRALGGRTISDYTQERIWDPLGMEHDGAWCVDHEPGGLEKTGCCLVITARDLAKIGRLYLRRGDWDGRRVVSDGWVRESTTVDTSDGSSWEYQRMWWLVAKDRPDFMAVGHLGQFLHVNPAKGVITVRIGRSTGKMDREQWTTALVSLSDRIP